MEVWSSSIFVFGGIRKHITDVNLALVQNFPNQIIFHIFFFNGVRLMITEAKDKNIQDPIYSTYDVQICPTGINQRWSLYWWRQLFAQQIAWWRCHRGGPNHWNVIPSDLCLKYDDSSNGGLKTHYRFRSLNGCNIWLKRNFVGLSSDMGSGEERKPNAVVKKGIRNRRLLIIKNEYSLVRTEPEPGVNVCKSSTLIRPCDLSETETTLWKLSKDLDTSCFIG